MNIDNIKIESSWKNELLNAFQHSTFEHISLFLHDQKKQGKTIYPPGNQIFNAFELTPFSEVKVVILGQDPYHGVGQAMGLSFSVPQNVAIPASLKNIYKEIQTDLGITAPNHGNLTAWAKQGVFLLNAILTVEANKAASHKDIGWQHFTDEVIKTLTDKKEKLVFLLWGNFARQKKLLIDSSKHFVLEAAHPSPLAGGAFFGCKHFSQTNEYLSSVGKTPIDWSLE